MIKYITKERHFLLYLFFPCLLLLNTTNYLYAQPLTIVEGKGIEALAVLGQSMDLIEQNFGKAESLQNNPYENPVLTIYQYFQHGLLIIADENNNIVNITLFSNPGEKAKHPEVPLLWNNEFSKYKTFKGITLKGLILKDQLKPKDIYKIYGKPRMDIYWDFDEMMILSKLGIPYIRKMYDEKNNLNDNGYSIEYPSLGLSFTVFNDFVESLSISPPQGALEGLHLQRKEEETSQVVRHIASLQVYDYYVDNEGNNVLHGQWQSLNREGGVYLEGYNMHGNRIGTWSYYNKDGTIQIEDIYNEQGKVKERRTYLKGRLSNLEKYSKDTPFKHGDFYSIYCSHASFSKWAQGEKLSDRFVVYKTYSWPKEIFPPAWLQHTSFNKGENTRTLFFLDGKLISAKTIEENMDF